MDSSESIVNQRKEKVLGFLKAKADWIVYVILAFIVYLSFRIRTANVAGLKDISTNDWTLGPDLDPFLFLRWSKHIITNGSLFAVDTLRYVPRGFETAGEYLLHPYMMAWFHNIFAGIFSWSATQSAIYYPVFMFALTVVAFFLFVRKAFAKFVSVKESNAIALIASFFLSVMPSLLPRTIAGIPEKESAAFLFMFLAFYFFLVAWDSNKRIKSLGFAALAGFATACMSFIWGGSVFVFFIIGPSVLISFLLGNVNRAKMMTFGMWIISSSIFMLLLFNVFTLRTILSSSSTGSSIIVFGIMLVHEFLTPIILRRSYQARKISSKISVKLFSTIITIILGIILVSIFFGPSTLTNTISDLYFKLVKPAQTRLITTVAENRQPYFNEWASQFGPNVRSVYLTFWIFFIASIVLVYELFAKIFDKKDRILLVIAYVFLLSMTVFTRYSPGSTFNGENAISLGLYAMGGILFVFTFAKMVYRLRSERNTSNLREINLGILMTLVFFFLGIVGSRGLIRLILVLVAPGAMLIGYLSVKSWSAIRNNYSKKDYVPVIFGLLIIFSTIFAGYTLYKVSYASAQSYVPSAYNQQWQKAMSWVRDNTAISSVFGHWWDYGYWIQSIGERATVLDGGNNFPYWNHLMGRYGLTAPSEREALEFLYPHNVTHFLIDSTDIGKYGAFSAIGSDANYDRRSWIPTMVRDNAQTVERKNTTVQIYSGGSTLDQDITYTLDGTEIFLPGNKAAIGAIILETDKNGSIQNVEGVFVYQGNQYILPIRYYYDTQLIDTGKGVDAGIFLMPRLVTSSSGAAIESRGALLYLSPRVVHSQLARIYLYGEETAQFKLAHTESDFLIQDIRRQGIANGEFIFFNDFRGPIKIWDVKYPASLEFKKEYLDTVYPEQLLRA
ncbi:MAG: STT3 domain-containing protein [Candidatus Pacearchaeota archaeon]